LTHAKSHVAVPTLSYKKDTHILRVNYLTFSLVTMQIIFLFHFLSFCAVSLAFNVPQDYIIGLRANHTLQTHFAFLKSPINIQQHNPSINGYALPPSTNATLLSSIRLDPNVGFIVQKPLDFFSSNGHLGLKDDDLDDYEIERMWLTLQDQDPHVVVTDDGGM
jgi:hypothetical protein